MILTTRQREMIQHLWREGLLSRSELSGRMRLSANSVSTLANGLIRMGVLSEQTPQPSTGGRPRIPLDLDPTRCQVVGLSVGHGQVEAARLNLRGHLIGRAEQRQVDNATKLAATTAKLLERLVTPATMAIGVSAPGFVDPDAKALLFSAASPDQRVIRLEGLNQIAGDRPLVVENDMHALSARWLLTHRAVETEDVLLVYIGDGSLGAAVMIEGRPNRGSVRGGNELGHTRLPVMTERCYCGHTGCLEQICSTDFLRRNGASDDQTLWSLAEAGESAAEVLNPMLGHVATGIANAVNFIRPHRLVLVSQLTRYPAACSELTRQIRSLLLAELVERVRVDLWDRPVGSAAETAGWLGIASLFCEGWQPVQENAA